MATVCPKPRHPAGMPDGLCRAFAKPFHIFQFPVGVRSGWRGCRPQRTGRRGCDGRSNWDGCCGSDGGGGGACTAQFSRRSPSHVVTWYFHPSIRLSGLPVNRAASLLLPLSAPPPWPHLFRHRKTRAQIQTTNSITFVYICILDLARLLHYVHFTVLKT